MQNEVTLTKRLSRNTIRPPGAKGHVAAIHIELGKYLPLLRVLRRANLLNRRQRHICEVIRVLLSSSVKGRKN